jgi:hypothetical protein
MRGVGINVDMGRVSSVGLERCAYNAEVTGSIPVHGIFLLADPAGDGGRFKLVFR